MTAKIGVLVMSYGTPESLDGVEAYYTHIRRGHAPTAEQLKELKDRYEAIVGGVFPLRENTNRQVEALQEALNKSGGDVEYVCYQGLKHAKPFIEDGVEEMVRDGINYAVGVVLAPHYSVMSVGTYIKRAKEKAEACGITMEFVESYHLHPELIDVLSRRVSAKLDQFEETGAVRGDVRVLFSAHSLPERILAMGDPYVDQLLATSQAIAEQTNVTNWQFTWQSAGRTAEPWLGPDILDTMRELAKNEVKYVLSAPIGFVSDHLEVLYDLDIEAQALASELDLRLMRIESLNSDPAYMSVLSDVVRAKAGELKVNRP
ncbi:MULTISPECIES: ferrochelatase [unclassified Paenibacillus]|uniref:ferrochelatase n=1 Tax=unclassified Paenibacillus TaxID=185978 RepID=UPI002405D398|nr:MULTISPECIES: ferrochelatase [unclassified Paenibacillus]MDF9842203.1 ferrochelatase [Paenibacillus sp. PastF-2]MDF9848920.1 ferrochelatase [Paenibacillus sp. PastM-2]MDF9855490.1 ferrochelatase [Paenibacillus sp. PastF-1]MDH6480634.1 ferrochelatase [Paenibacillus sp. PastH-2]MDH6508184.1 ferrochelatase [Paenibacillus sp. PastM-3]